MTENEFSPFVRILGKGKTGSRSLSESEAFAAMRLILSGEVEDVQLGAFLMLLRVKEESAEELAGFVRAARESFAEKRSNDPMVNLDWSSYAGKRKQPHWFLLSALLLAQSGYKVFMHGARGHTEGRVYTQEILEALKIPVAGNIAEAQQHISDSKFAYLPLGNFCPTLEHIIGLRPLFGLRSPVHTLCRLLNPLRANATLQSVFHPAYMHTHRKAAELLGEKNSCVLKGDAGEVEYRPHASVKLMRLSNGVSLEQTLQRRAKPPEIISPNTNGLLELWKSDNAELHNHYGYHAVMGTTAIALLTLSEAKDELEAYGKAQVLWSNRNTDRLY